MCRFKFGFCAVLMMMVFMPVSFVHGQGRLAISKSLEKNLQLDEETAYPGPLGSTFQYCADTDEIVYFNRITTTLKFYAYSSGKQTREIAMEMEGPNTIGPDPFYCYYHNKDSIFVLSRGNNFRLNLMNGEGEKINTYPFGEPDNFELPLPASATVFGALQVADDRVYLAVDVPWRELGEEVAPIIVIDLKTKSSQFLSRPKPYRSLDLDRIVAPNQHRTEYYSTRIAYHPQKDNLLINYALEESLYLLSKDGVTTINGKSKLLGEIQFLKQSRDSYRKNSKQLLEPIYASGWYHGVIYDGFRDCYYRIGKASVEKSKVRRKLNGEKIKIPYEYVVMAFDGELKFMDEIKFSTKDGIVHRGIFVGPDGLHIAQLNTKGEDVMGFTTITLSTDEKN